MQKDIQVRRYHFLIAKLLRRQRTVACGYVAERPGLKGSPSAVHP